VFLLLLCNDREVLGPWVNGRKTNMFTAAVVAVLVSLSVILTASVLFPDVSSRQIIEIMMACGVAGMLAACYALARRLRTGAAPVTIDRTGQENWRMPPLAVLSRPAMSAGRKIGMGALRLYLGAAMILVIVKIAQLATGH
jgi:protein-S-isoprenylcysteine O-methyltransferase Ste14